MSNGRWLTIICCYLSYSQLSLINILLRLIAMSAEMENVANGGSLLLVFVKLMFTWLFFDIQISKISRHKKVTVLMTFWHPGLEHHNQSRYTPLWVWCYYYCFVWALFSCTSFVEALVTWTLAALCGFNAIFAWCSARHGDMGRTMDSWPQNTVKCIWSVGYVIGLYIVHWKLARYCLSYFLWDGCGAR